jgi:hypothetical protein
MKEGWENLFGALEKDVLALALGAFQGDAVFVFPMDADPRAAIITSSAQQQPTEPRKGASMPVYKLRDRVFLDIGRTNNQRNCIVSTHQTLLAPSLYRLSFFYGP